MGVMKALVFAGAMAGAAYLTYKNHDALKKAEFVLYKGFGTVAEDFFQDPPGLENSYRRNKEGAIEVYNVHKESGAETEVLKDMLPRTGTMVDGIRKRYRNGFKGSRSFARDFLELAREDVKSLSAEEQEALGKELQSFGHEPGR